MKEFLKNKAKDFMLNLSEEKLEQFKTYYDFLVEFNSHTNLIAKADEQTILTKHFLDSMAFNKIPDASGAFKLMDIGSGGGFPALPIAILYPEAQVVAVDSVGKKIIFLTQAAEKIGIQRRFKALNIRSEELPLEHREKYDFVTARALAPLNILVEYCLPYVKVGGFLVAYKAKTAKDEIKEAKNALNMLGGMLAEVIEYNLGDDIERNLIIIEKTDKTSRKFPRKAGLPKKNPL
ncbi:MAG: 16S rRNA (guanine(527)-N(7))-methyltransferase RsmG [bacterium]